MSDYSKPLDSTEWSMHYNLNILNHVVDSINNNTVSVWSEELCKIIPQGKSCLEIGCGTGISSLWLAKNGRIVTALDYTESSIALVDAAKESLNLSVETMLFDATKELPYEKNQFDYAFSCGLLEHFESDEQIALLKNWKRCCKYMISMIPNSSSVPYMVGKKIMEEAETWEYGLEMPKHSMAKEFTLAELGGGERVYYRGGMGYAFFA